MDPVDETTIRKQTPRALGSKCKYSGKRETFEYYPLVGSSFSSAQSGFVDLLINLGDFANPDLSLLVFHIENGIKAPVEVIGDVGDLLVDLFQRVAQYSPIPVPMFTSNSC
jgi:hypothetical protein